MIRSDACTIKLMRKVILILFILLLTLSCTASKKQPSLMKNADGRMVTTNKRAEIVFVRSPALAYNDPIIVRTTDEKLRFVGSLPQNGKISYTVIEGRHTFLIIGENIESMQTRVLAGYTYYVIISPKFGVYKNRVSMVPVSEKDLELPEIQHIINSAHYYQPDISGYKWLEENVNTVHSYRQQAKITSTILPSYGVDKPIDSFTVKNSKKKESPAPKLTSPAVDNATIKKIDTDDVDGDNVEDDNLNSVNLENDDLSGGTSGGFTILNNLKVLNKNTYK